MDELLTSKQVQELLQVDRTTVYRMLKDGRLNGVKIGNQWRFPRREIDNLLSLSSSTQEESDTLASDVLPIGCIQAIQEVFAEIAEVGTITTDKNGSPITKFSNSCEFCKLIMESPSGYQACIASWQQLAKEPERAPQFVPCHAGLQYARGWISIGPKPIAMIVAGQFYVHPPEPEEEVIRLRRLATVHQIDARALVEASLTIPLLDERKQAQIGIWMEKVANTFGEIGRERANLIHRLKTISEMSAID